MSTSLDALAAARDQIRFLRKAFGAVCAVSLVAMFLLRQVPVHLTIHPAPNMRAGDAIDVKSGVSPVPPPNVYGFGIYIWQHVNRWAKDGTKDYGQQIFTLQHYLTPACQDQLKTDMESRSAAGELYHRTRTLSEIPGQAYSHTRVIPDGDNAWTVVLDMRVNETVRGVPVKDAYVRYPIRVVRFDVDREKNQWQLAVDCFGGNRPERLDPSVANRTLVTADTLVPAPLPPTKASDATGPAAATPVPSTLPRETPSPEVRP